MPSGNTTTIKNALKKWEEATGRKAGEAREIKLIAQYPPIERMEGPFHLLINCEKFSLSTNCIANINNLQAFKNLKILSLGRNVIKNLQVCSEFHIFGAKLSVITDLIRCSKSNRYLVTIDEMILIEQYRWLRIGIYSIFCKFHIISC